MAVPINHEIEYEGVTYVLVDSALLMRLYHDKTPCMVCGLRPHCGAFDCIIDGPEVGVYVKKLKEG